MSTWNPSTAAPWLQILQGFLTPVIGVTTIYIAWQQWKRNERKLVLDRYERRLRIPVSARWRLHSPLDRLRKAVSSESVGIIRVDRSA